MLCNIFEAINHLIKQYAFQAFFYGTYAVNNDNEAYLPPNSFFFFF